MADYAVWGEAISQAMGNKPEEYCRDIGSKSESSTCNGSPSNTIRKLYDKICKTELLDKGKIEWKGQPDDLMESLTTMIDDKILRVDKRELQDKVISLYQSLTS